MTVEPRVRRAKLGRSRHLFHAPIHHINFAELPHHDVFRFEVAVNHPPAVGEGDALAQALEDAEELCRPGRRAGAGSAYSVGQGAAADELHGVIEPAVRQPAEVVDGRDRRVLQ